jgi:hypothetical protein
MHGIRKFNNPIDCNPSITILNLHLGKTVLPDGDVRRDTILTVVEEDNHAVGVHRLAGEELVVLEVADDLLGEALSLGLEILDLGLVSTLGLESLLNGLHVACGLSVMRPLEDSIERTLKVCEVALLVEASSVQTERVDNIDDLLLGVLGTLLSLLSGSVGTSVYTVISLHCHVSRLSGAGKRTELLSTNGDLPAVGLVGNAIDLLEVVGVGDDLVVGDDVLRQVLARTECYFALSQAARHVGAPQWRKGGVAAQQMQTCTHLEDNHSGGGVL